MDNAPLLFRASLHVPGQELLYATGDVPSEITGCAFIRNEANGNATVIVRGQGAIFDYCFAKFPPGTNNTYEYILQSDIEKFAKQVHPSRSIPPVVQYIACCIPSMHPVSLPKFGPEYSFVEFSRVHGEALVAFNEYSPGDASLSILKQVKGYCLKKNDPAQSIIASGYDAFSILPVDLPVAAIGGIRVAARERNRGWCKVMVGMLVQELYSAGKSSIFLHVSPENKAALRCYETIGFEKRATYYRVNSSNDD